MIEFYIVLSVFITGMSVFMLLLFAVLTSGYQKVDEEDVGLIRTVLAGSLLGWAWPAIIVWVIYLAIKAVGNANIPE